MFNIYEMNKLKHFIDKFKYLPEQGSERWLNERKISIGGSELYSLKKDKKQIIRRKINLDTMVEALPMLWGTVLEDLTQFITSIICGCVILNAPGSIPSCEVDGKTYSPDGLGFMRFACSKVNDKDTKCHVMLYTLFEFKTLWSRFPEQDVVYKNYVDQVKSGLADLSLVQVGLYSESYIRLCNFEQLQVQDRSHNETIHTNRKGMPYTDVLADGFLLVYLPITKKPISDEHANMLNVMRGVVGLPISPNQSAIDPELAEYFDSTGYDQNGQIKSCNIEKNNNGSENMYDWGNDGSKFNYFYLFKLIKYGILKTKYSPINTYPEKFTNVTWMNHQKRKIPKLATNHNNTKKLYKKWLDGDDSPIECFGIIPWKLFDINLVTVEKEVGYTKKHEQLIHDTLAHIKQLNSIENEEEKYNKFYQDTAGYVVKHELGDWIDPNAMKAQTEEEIKKDEEILSGYF